MSNPQGSFHLPPQLSTIAADVDALYMFILWLSAVFFIGIVGAMGYFVYKYRRKPGVVAEPTGEHTVLEVFWTFTPLVILAFLFVWGWQGFVRGAVAPADAIEIQVQGQQWSWEFTYPNGGTSNELTVPVGKPVRLVMSSADVIHSFFVPAFRVKRDVVPGMYTTLWFEATDVGDVDVLCAEYCGAPAESVGNAGHSAMSTKVHVVTDEAYAQFLQTVGTPQLPAECEGNPNPQACWGEKLYVSKACVGCHAVDGERTQPAPNFKGLWAKNEQLTGGATAQVDENYLRESILQPTAKVVNGYAPIMPPYPNLRDEELGALIAYIKSLSQ